VPFGGIGAVIARVSGWRFGIRLLDGSTIAKTEEYRIEVA